MVSPINESYNYTKSLPTMDFAFGTPITFTYEAKDFDGVISRWSFLLILKE